MNRMFALLFLASTASAGAEAATWVTAEMTTTATLRMAETLPSNSGYKDSHYLKKVIDLPSGTKLRYVPANSTTASYLYQTSSGSLKYSRYGWVRTILVDDIPGTPFSHSEMTELNRRPLFISKSLEKTFKVGGDGDSDAIRPPSGGYNTTLCYSRLTAQGLPSRPLANLFNFYNSNQGEIPQKRYLAMSDYSINSRSQRFYLIDLANCSYQNEIVAHGSGTFTSGGVRRAWGDPEHDGMLNRCVYAGRRQNMTRPGFALIKGYHYSSQSWPKIASNGAKGLKLYALGRAKNENFNLIGRGVVMHEQYYVSNTPAGRSYGCPALKPGHLKPKVSILKSGVLYYSYAPQCGTH